MTIPARDNGTALRAVEGKSQRMVVAVTCDKCQRREAGSDKPNCPLDLIVKHFAAKGWRIAGRGSRATCPECQQREATPQTADESAIFASLDRQREAEERRRTSESPIVKPVAPPDDRTWARAMLDALPAAKGRGKALLWSANPEGVARLVGIFNALPRDGRIKAFAALVGDDRGAMTSAFYQFRRGLTADGGKPWPELREAMQRLGIPIQESKERDDVSKQAAATPTHSTITSREAERARAQVVRLLDAHFAVPDGGNVGTYADGWSDDRVAKESGLSVDKVAAIRSAVHGEIVDPRVLALQSQLAAERQRFAEDAAGLRQMLETLQRDHAAAMASLETRLRAILTK